MIVHLVLFKFKPGVSRADPEVDEVIAGMSGLPRRIPVIRGWEHGFNRTEDPLAWDYGLRALFDDEHDLHGYFDHPQHVAVLRQWEAISDLVFCDYALHAEENSRHATSQAKEQP